jgi:ABC-type branched-subunit amino acid transport system permease subunit
MRAVLGRAKEVFLVEELEVFVAWDDRRWFWEEMVLVLVVLRRLMVLPVGLIAEALRERDAAPLEDIHSLALACLNEE